MARLAGLGEITRQLIPAMTPDGYKIHIVACTTKVYRYLNATATTLIGGNRTLTPTQTQRSLRNVRKDLLVNECDKFLR